MAASSVGSDVAVSIETIDECHIQEITLDGQEIYVQLVYINSVAKIKPALLE